MSQIRIGCCGFALPQKEYFRTFPLIEIQKTFYQPPQRKTAERWRDQAGPKFEFTLKAFQAITHSGSSPTFRRSKLTQAERRQCGSFRNTEVVWRAWQQIREIASAVQATWVIFQCPARFEPTGPNLANLRHFFAHVERDGRQMGFEPRGQGWSDEILRSLCGELDLIHVVDPFRRQSVTGSPCYYRLHGIGQSGRYDYNYRYTEADLKRLGELCPARATTYCLFNNVSMAEDARRFRTRLTP